MYRSRSRKTKRQEREDAERFARVEAMLQQHREELNQLRGLRQQDPAPDSTVGPSQQKSSVASMEGHGNDATMDVYPMDAIKEKTSCEMHVELKNISMKVAVGFALPSAPGATYHCNPIPAGYARVGVDEVQPMC